MITYEQFLNKNGKNMTQKIKVNNYNIQQIIFEEIKKYGWNADLNHIDVSEIKNMRGLFANTEFNGDISEWDVSNVTSMKCMFYNSEFNGDIFQWDVSNVTDMGYMFYNSQFNKDISNWNVSNVINMAGMFSNSYFNQDLTNWKPLNLKYKNFMFLNCESHFPYWAEAEDTPAAVRRYLLEKKLQSKLQNNNDIKKKIKI